MPVSTVRESKRLDALSTRQSLNADFSLLQVRIIQVLYIFQNGFRRSFAVKAHKLNLVNHTTQSAWRCSLLIVLIPHNGRICLIEMQ